MLHNFFAGLIKPVYKRKLPPALKEATARGKA